MFRYIERAENIARLIDAGLRMSLTQKAGDDNWDGVLQSAGVREAYDEPHAKLTSADAIDFLLRDRSNPSSVMSCIDSGRNNARMVRTALTRETWEATNECWIELKASCCPGAEAGRPAGSDRRHQAPRRPDPRRVCTARCCATNSTISPASAPSSSGPTTPAAFST
jgi:uncharacterized alpha-E superfamily protein